jgi:hypothetical protein
LHTKQKFDVVESKLADLRSRMFAVECEKADRSELRGLVSERLLDLELGKADRNELYGHCFER